MWRLDQLTDSDRLQALLPDLEPGDAASFALLASHLTSGHTAPTRRAVAIFVPGRIELVGKHTDYAGGRSLVVACKQGFHLVAAARADRTLQLADLVRCQATQLPLRSERLPSGGWKLYAATVARRLVRNFPSVGGADVSLASDLPAAAGMSSSSALMIGIFFALAALYRLDELPEYRRVLDDRLALAGYLAAIEGGWDYRGLGGGGAGRDGVGTEGGAQDHTAILCSAAGRVGRFRYRPLVQEASLRLPPGYRFAIANSGVRATKTGNAREKFNRVSRLAAAAAEIWRQGTGGDEPHLGAILASAPDAYDRLRHLLASTREAPYPNEELLSRAEQFRVESEEIVPAAATALERGDLLAFGRQVDRSQRRAEQLLGNQVAETSFLAHSARELGAAAASAFGAGFGGSVWALVPDEQAISLVTRWQRRFFARFRKHSHQARFLLTDASGGAWQLPPLTTRPDTAPETQPAPPAAD